MRKSILLGIGVITVFLSGVNVVRAEMEPLDVTDNGQKMSGDPVHGEKVFRLCMVCHTIEAGVNKIGPSLHGVVGRPAGSIPDFNYSPANKKSGIVWTEQKIFDYLVNPQKTVPGTKMAFGGLAKAQDRADVVAWLKQNSK
jgi:cytochrome c